MLCVYSFRIPCQHRPKVDISSKISGIVALCSLYIILLVLCCYSRDGKGQIHLIKVIKVMWYWRSSTICTRMRFSFFKQFKFFIYRNRSSFTFFDTKKTVQWNEILGHYKFLYKRLRKMFKIHENQGVFRGMTMKISRCPTALFTKPRDTFCCRKEQSLETVPPFMD